jgi:hypothetical protein
MVNVPDVEPAGIVKLVVDSVAFDAPVLSATTCPPTGAGPFKDTVPVVVPPLEIVDGLSVTDDTATASTVNVAALDKPPPGDGLLTLTLTEPAVANEDVGIDTVNCVGEMYVGVRITVFTFTVLAGVNPVPVIVIVNGAPPAYTVDGLIVETVGTE